MTPGSRLAVRVHLRRCWMELRSSSLTVNFENHSFKSLSLCMWTLSCWNRIDTVCHRDTDTVLLLLFQILLYAVEFTSLVQTVKHNSRIHTPGYAFADFGTTSCWGLIERTEICPEKMFTWVCYTQFVSIWGVPSHYTTQHSPSPSAWSPPPLLAHRYLNPLFPALSPAPHERQALLKTREN